MLPSEEVHEATTGRTVNVYHGTATYQYDGATSWHVADGRLRILAERTVIAEHASLSWDAVAFDA